MHSIIARRETRRKQRIRQLLESKFGGRPVLLDELRWAVWDSESADGRSRHEWGARSWLNSFARTIREQFPELTVQKIPINGRTPVGMVARTALYRLKNHDDLRAFLHSEEACILCRFQMRLNANYPRYGATYVIQYFHAATFRFFDRQPVNLSYDTIGGFPGTFVPATQPLSLIVAQGDEPDLRALASVPWKLLGYEEDLNDRYQVDPHIGLAAVKRDCRA